MSVILEFEDYVVSQGWSGYINIDITNSGDENIKDAKLKIIDASVFTSLSVLRAVTGFQNCLNTFCAGPVNFGGDKYLPAGNTEFIRFGMVIKAGAPIVVHNIQADWTFTVY